MYFAVYVSHSPTFYFSLINTRPELYGDQHVVQNLLFVLVNVVYDSVILQNEFGINQKPETKQLSNRFIQYCLYTVDTISS